MHNGSIDIVMNRPGFEEAPSIDNGATMGKSPKFFPEAIEPLRQEFMRSLAVFLEVCAEKGMEPRRNYSGKFNLRIPPELHEQLAIAAQAEGKSIHSLAAQALAMPVAS